MPKLNQADQLLPYPSRIVNQQTSKPASISVLFTTLVALTTALTLHTANAQELEGCFMQNSSGQLVKLNSLCSSPPPNAPSNNSGTAGTATRPGVFQVAIKRRMGNIPVVEVTFNNQHTFEMLLDTGASGTVITPAMATQLQVVPHSTVLVNTPSSRGVPFAIARITSMEVGGLIVNNPEVAIAGPELPIGLLGQNFFGDYDISIKQNVIEFHARR